MPTVIQLKWSDPQTIKEVVEDCNAISTGIYCISRNTKDTEELLYVGKADHESVRDRLKNHKASWTDKYRKVVVRYTIIPASKIGSEDFTNKMLSIEGALIYKYQPKENVANRKSYRPAYDYCIKNIKNPIISGEIPSTFGLSLTDPPKTKICPRKRKDDDDFWF